MEFSGYVHTLGLFRIPSSTSKSEGDPQFSEQFVQDLKSRLPIEDKLNVSDGQLREITKQICKLLDINSISEA